MAQHNAYEHTVTHQIMPDFYLTFGGRRNEESDTKFISDLLSRLNRKDRITACDNYSNDYCKFGPVKSNENLSEFVEKYGSEKPVTFKDKFGDKDYSNHRLSAKIEELRNSKKRKRSKYSLVFDD